MAAMAVATELANIRIISQENTRKCQKDPIANPWNSM